MCQHSGLRWLEEEKKREGREGRVWVCFSGLTIVGEADSKGFSDDRSHGKDASHIV